MVVVEWVEPFESMPSARTLPVARRSALRSCGKYPDLTPLSSKGMATVLDGVRYRW